MSKRPAPPPVHGETKIDGEFLTIAIEHHGVWEYGLYRWNLIEETPAIPGPAIHLQRLEADGSPCRNFAYDVAVTEFGPVCTCADFEFRRSDQPPELACKHVRACIAVKLIPGGKP